jgi:hypothetical protein
VAAILKLFKADFSALDVILSAVAAAAVSLIPAVGGAASFAVAVAILHWRVGAKLIPDIFVAVAVSRLAILPVLLMFKV